MRELAETIRARSEALARTYSRRLKSVPGYAHLSAAERMNVARAALGMVVAYADSQDDAAFTQAIQALVEARIREGWSAGSLLQALIALEETVIPVVTTAKSAKLLWQAFAKAHGVVSAGALRSLQESEQRYRKMAEEVGDILYISDPRGYFTYVNPACERLLGRPASEIVGRHFSELIAPEWRERVVAFYGQQFRNRVRETVFELPVMSGSGEIRWIDQRVTLLSDGDWVTGFQTIGHDVTERKQLEEALRESEAKFRELVDRALVGIFRTTPSGEIVEANPAVLQLLRHESLEAANRFGLNNMYVDLADRQRLLQAVQQGPVTGFETRFRRGDGEIVTISIGAHLVRDEEGKPLFLEGTLEDITERKRLEDRVRELSERRGRQVQTSTEVAQEIAAAPALEELFRRVVTLIKERFGYYHAQIFRYEPALDAVLLVASYGEAGERLLARGHRLAMGRGVVGTAAATGRPILAPDVAQDKDWRPNPDLPDTKGELAVPIKLRDQVLGILDVQSDQVGALTEDDQLLLEGLCGQIAVAIESTRLRQEMDARLSELSALYRAASREGWQSLRAQAELPAGYLFDRVDVHPAEDVWLPEVGQAVEQNAFVPPAADGAAAVAPLAVHGEVIGVLGVYEDPQQPMAAEELEIVRSVSEQVALALETARLSQQTQMALEESQALYQATSEINAARSYEEVLAALRRHTVLGQADRLSSINLFDTLWTADQEPRFFEVPARWTTLPAERFPAHYDLAEYPAIRALRPEAPIVVGDIAQADGIEGATQRLYRENFGGRSMLIVPLAVGGQLIGFVDGVWGQSAALTEAAVRRVMALAGQAAAVVQSIRQLEITRQRAGQEQALREVTAAINASQDLLKDLPLIAQGLRGLVGLDGLALATYAPGEDELTIVAVELTTEQPAPPLQPGVRIPVSGTAYGWVVTHGQPCLESDLRDAAQSEFIDSTFLVAQGLGSRLILPVTVGRQSSGALVLVAAQPGAFREEHIPLLQPVADQMGLALERARLLQETQAALAEVEATHRGYLRGQWQDYLRRREALRQGGFLFERSAVSAAPDLWRPEISRVVQEQAPVVVGGDGEGEGRTGLAIPITLRGQVIGVLGVEDPEGARQWSEQDLTLVQAVGQQLALALENARLLEETRRRAERDRMIAEITSRVRASSDIETILQTAVQQLGAALGTDRAFVRLGEAAPASPTGPEREE